MMMKKSVICIAFVLSIFATGCTRAVPDSSASADTDSADSSGRVSIGGTLTVGPVDSSLQLLDNNSALAANGMYYATWVTGDSVPYENSDGETVDLYDAQIYLLLEETKTPETAQENMDTWLETAKSNYEITDETQDVYNNQTYTVISYTCDSPDNPYARGISAFCTSENTAACIELTCVENFQGDLNTMLTDFLNSCTFSTQG